MITSSSSRAARLRAGAFVALALVAPTLAGCAPAGTTPGPMPSASQTTAPEPEGEPTLHPDGSAVDNLPVFRLVTAEVWASDARSKGQAYIDALVAAGFPKDRMQVTADVSTVGNQAESLQFSVAWGEDECLIGQVGPSTGEPVTAVMSQLAEGRCLIGRTRPVE